MPAEKVLPNDPFLPSDDDFSVSSIKMLLSYGRRLVEVNGVPVVGATLKELEDVLLQGTSAQLVVLRQPPPSLLSQQQPLLQGSDGEAVSIETTPPRKAIAI